MSAWSKLLWQSCKCLGDKGNGKGDSKSTQNSPEYIPSVQAFTSIANGEDLGELQSSNIWRSALCPLQAQKRPMKLYSEHQEELTALS